MPLRRYRRGMLPRLTFAAARATPVLVAVVGAAALLSGCGSSSDASTSPAPPASSAAPSASGSLDIGAPSAGSESAAPSGGAASDSAAPSDAASPSASVPTNPAYTLADAIVDQLGTTPPESLSDELVTIAVSPQLRQVAATYGVTTAIDVKGPRVILTITGKDLDKVTTCVVTVADAPQAARGFACE